MSKDRAWIETTHLATEQRTAWRVVSEGEVLQSGDVHEDLAGTSAYDVAQRWAQDAGVMLVGWKHAIDRGISDSIVSRPRTSTDNAATPMRLYGWANCTDGGREAVAVTPQQMRALEDGSIPCPVCGEACGVTLEPTTDVEGSAVAWNGVRWHGH